MKFGPWSLFLFFIASFILAWSSFSVHADIIYNNGFCGSGGSTMNPSKDPDGIAIFGTSYDDFGIDGKDSLFGTETLWNWEPDINTLTSWTDPDTGITYIEPRIGSGLTDNGFYGDIYSAGLGWIRFGVPGVDRVTVDTAAVMNPYVDPSPVIGYAWSENAGWILFSDPTCINLGCRVEYIPQTQTLSGYAWSPTAGYLSMSGIHASATPPPGGLCNFMIDGLADHAKVVNMPQTYSSGYGLGVWDFRVEAWTGGAMVPYLVPISSGNPPTVTHDLRRSGLYGYQLYSPDGWILTGSVAIYSREPTEIPVSSGACQLSIRTVGCEAVCGSPGPACDYLNDYPFINPASLIPKKADNIEEFIATLSLRDRYGNPVIPVPNVKAIQLSAVIENTIKRNQIGLGPFGGLPFGTSTGEAIRYNVMNDFGFSPLGDAVYDSGIWVNTGTAVLSGMFTTGDYSLPFSSYAPSSAAYAWAGTGNDIRIVSMKYEVIPLSGTGVGETSEIDISPLVYPGYLQFLPLVQVANVNNFTGGFLYGGAPIAIDGEIIQTGSSVLSQAYISSIISVADIYNSTGVTFVEMTGSAPGTNYYCAGFLNETGTYVYDDSDCDRSTDYASNLTIQLNDFITPSITFPIEARSVLTMPMLSGAYVPLRYTSEVYYTFSDGTQVIFPSFNVLADAMYQSGGLSFSGVRVVGRTNHNNVFVTTDETMVDPFGTITKQDVRLLVQKNIALLTRSDSTNQQAGSYKYYDSSNGAIVNGYLNLDDWSDWEVAGNARDTIIVYGANVYISGDLPFDTAYPKPHGLIVLKDINGSGGNIYISSGVTDLAMIMYADRTLFSGECGGAFGPGCDAYKSPTDKINQLHFFGSLIANNTIGGSPQYIAKCPYDAPTCLPSTAYQYDLNHFRYYDGVTGLASSNVPVGMENYSFLLEYDSRVITKPPTGFKDIKW